MNLIVCISGACSLLSVCPIGSRSSHLLHLQVAAILLRVEADYVVLTNVLTNVLLQPLALQLTVLYTAVLAFDYFQKQNWNRSGLRVHCFWEPPIHYKDGRCINVAHLILVMIPIKKNHCLTKEVRYSPVSFPLLEPNSRPLIMNCSLHRRNHLVEPILP